MHGARAEELACHSANVCRQPLAAFKLRVPSARARAEAAKIFEELAFKQIPSKLDTIWKGMESAREAFMA